MGQVEGSFGHLRFDGTTYKMKKLRAYFSRLSSGGTNSLGSGTTQTQSPRLCQAVVPLNVSATGNGIASTSKIRNETLLDCKFESIWDL